MEVHWILTVVLITLKMCEPLPVENSADGKQEIDIRMPGVAPNQDDEYWCYAQKVPTGTKYITQFEALARGDVAHHILVYGCIEPGEKNKTWSCGFLCSKGSSKILFAWARNAPPTHMPKDVGFKIGDEDSGVYYIVLQIHYRHGFKRTDPADHSGMRITVTEQQQKYIAGVMIMLASNLRIPAHAPKVSTNMSCRYNGATAIYPFAFRTHAHSLATVISGYQYNNTWDMLGKGNPQWPQAFYPMSRVHTVKPGDYLIAQCTYNATKMNTDTYIGATHNDEMCNFYMMYYTDSTNGKSYLECFDDDFPRLSKMMPAGSDIPPPRNETLEAKGDGHVHHHNTVEEPSQTNSDLLSLQAVTVINGWPTIKDSDKVVLGQVGGIATDSKGNLHVFHRGSRVWDERSFNAKNKFLGSEPIKENTLLTFDASGNLIDQWGSDMFYMPHGLYLDHQDNIWVTDVAMHQVMRFPAGSHKADLTLGKKLTPGKETNQFCKPADVVVLETGEFYVADGYCNSRIMKFSKDGTFIKQWGGASKNVLGDGYPPPSTFAIPHSIVNLKKHKTLCVADRENGRIQCFDYDGKFVKQIHIPEFGSRVFAVTYCPDLDILYAVNGANSYKKDIKVQGFTLDYNKGTLMEIWGPEKGFSRPHDVTVSNGGKDLFVGEIGPNKVWKFKVNTTKVSHQSVKRPGTHTAGGHHPQSVDSSSDEVTEQKIEKSEETDFGVSIVIGALLIIPVLVIIIIVVFLRVRKRSHEMGYKLVMPDEEDYDDEDDLWVKSQMATGKKVSFQRRPLIQHNGASTKEPNRQVHMPLVFSAIIHFSLFSLSDYKQKNRRFNLGEFFGRRHKGFDPLSTDDNGELDHLNSDSDDVEEYSATSHKA